MRFLHKVPPPLRYPPAMSINKAAKEPATESFADVIERLTVRAANLYPTPLRGLDETPQHQTSRENLHGKKMHHDKQKLEDGLASVSYERALRTHSRYKPETEAPKIAAESIAPLPTPQSPIPQNVAPIIETPDNAFQDDPGPNLDPGPDFYQSIEQPLAPDPSEQPNPGSLPSRTQLILNASLATRQLELKQCTISVRLNRAESEILRLRAAESGMTISAYIRSCVLEADQLRAQVKMALAELRAKTIEMEAPVIALKKQSWSFLAWFHPRAESLRLPASSLRNPARESTRASL